MTRTSSLALLLAFTACNDSAEVLTPDTGTPEAGSDVQTSDVTTPDASDATTNDGQSEATTDASDDGDADADAGCQTGYELCNGICTDISTYQTDQTNCGFCGHDCQGNTCTTGICASDTIGNTLPSPSYLAVDGTNVYVTTSGDIATSTSGEVYQCPVTGCPTKLGPMTSGLNNPNAIAVDSSKVYWDNSGDLGSADGSVMSCPLTDCGKNDASRVTIAKNIQFVQGISLDSTNVYFDVFGPSPYGNGYAGSCPLAGCSGSPASIITGQYKPLYVAVDGSSLFMAAPGGSSSVAYLESGVIPGPSTGTRVWTGSIMNHISGFALYASQLYFADDFKGEIYMCPESSCTTPVTLSTGLSAPASLAVDSQGIYWIDGNGIERCSLTGCGATPTLLATSTLTPVNLAVSGSYVYWVEDDFNNTNAGTIKRVAR